MKVLVALILLRVPWRASISIEHGASTNRNTIAMRLTS